MKLSETMNLPEYVQTALRLLENGGFEGFVVGGGVRDFLMGKEPHDYDIACSALTEDMKRCFDGFRVIETGIKHGTLTVVIDGNNLEITTFRIDGEYEDNRHPKQVAFTDKLHDDLSRRDFTVNAMAYSPSSGFIDLFGGMQDLKKRIIKCVGNPDTRFNEDGLRILRALRFSSVLDFEIDSDTADSIHSNKNLLKNISVERIYSELVKLICGAGAERVLLEFSDVICVIIPEIEPTVGFDQRNPYHCWDVYTHSVKALAAAPKEKILRLAMLFHDIGKPASFTLDENGGHFYGHHTVSSEMTRAVLRRLNVDNRTVSAVVRLVDEHDREICPQEKSVRRVLRDMSREEFSALLNVKRADNLAQPESVRYRLAEIDELEKIADCIAEKDDCLSLKKLAINGDDLIELGFKKGKQVGETLNFLLEQVLDGNVENERSKLLAMAKKFLFSY